MNTEPIEAPDYQPEILTPLEQATLDRQNKDYIAEYTSLPKPQYSKKEILKTSHLFYVIKDNEYYLRNDGGGAKTTALEEAKFFDHIDAAEGYLNRKNGTSEFASFLIPSVQCVNVKTYHTTSYQEIP